MRRKKCKWCKELKQRSAFGKDVRLGCKPGDYCKSCIGLMNAYRKLREIGERTS